MEKRTIYAYSTKVYYEDKIAQGLTPWLKVGDTSRETMIRIGEQDGTSNPEKLELKFETEIPFEKRDYEVHKILEEFLGVIRLRDEREWFECDIDTVRKALNILKHGIARIDDFEMRPEQKDAHNKIISYFNSGGEEFLLAAKMRFGKNFTMLNVMKSMALNTMLVITYKPHVFNSLQKDIKNHVYFKDWNFIDLKEVRDPKISPDTPTVIVCSAQLALNKQRGEEDVDFVEMRKNLRKLAGIKFDLIMADEYHYGTSSENFKNLLKELNYKYITYVSGTAMRDIEMGRFDEEQIYSWSYIDEQKKKQEGSIYHQMMPTMKMYLVGISEQAKDLMEEHYDIAEGFTLTKMFGADRNLRTLSNKAALKQFLIQVMKGSNVHQTMCPYLLEPDLDHTFWVLPKNSVAIQETARLMRSMPEFEGYHIIEATGNEVTNIKEVEKAIRRYPRTITLSCYRFKEGVTIPKWNGVLMLDDGSSIQEYLQAIFRCQNPNVEVNKQECYVFDFNPPRALSMVYDACENIDKTGVERHLSEIIREYLDCAPIFQATGNKMEKIDFNVIMENFRTNGSYSEKFANVKNINFDCIDEEIINSLSRITINKRGKTFEIGDVEFGVGAKNMKNVGTVEREEGEVVENVPKMNKSELNKIIAKIQTVLSNIPEFLFDSEAREENVKDIINTSEKDLFESITGIGIDTFKMWVEKKMINSSLLNRNIYYFLESEKEFVESDHTLEEKDSFFKRHFNMKAEDGSTPAALVNEMLDKLSEETWNDKNKVFCDPCMGTGNFVIAIKERLMKGLEQVIINEKEREKWIIENMIWCCDIDRSKWLITKKLMMKTNDYKHHIIQEDSLKYNFENMKFDVVVGNPPYQGPKKESNKGQGSGNVIWQYFVELSFNILKNDGYLCIIHPIHWRTDIGRKKLKNAQNLLFDNQMHFLKTFQTPFENIVTIVDWYIAQKTPKYKDTIIEFPNGIYKKYLKTEFIPNQGGPIIDSIINKVYNIDNNGLNVGTSWWFDPDKGINKKYKYVHGMKSFTRNEYKYYDTPHIHQNNQKIIIPDTGLIAYYDKGELGIAGHLRYILVNNEKEAFFVKSIIESRLMIFLQKIFSIDLWTGNYPKRWNNDYPMSRFKIDNKELKNDKDIYEYFNLNSKEIEYIESQIK